MASARVASAAVTHTRLAVEDELGWLFREQPTEDFGIDAHAEVVDGEDVRGRLLGLQIKGGMSWFSERAAGGWWFRPDAAHVRYWMSHSLPVVVVLYHPGTRRCHWQLVGPKTLDETRNGGLRLLVPEAHVLDGTGRAALQEAAQGDPDALRIREQLAGPGPRRPFPRRRAIALGGLAAITSAAVPVGLALSRGSSGTTAGATPADVIAYRVWAIKSEVYVVAFSPNGGTLATSGADGVIRLWHTATWAPAGSLHASVSGWAIAYSPDGTMLATGDGSKPAVQLWDLATKRPTTLRGQANRVFSVAAGSLENKLASASPEDNVEAWDVASRNHIGGFSAYQPVYCVAFGRDSQALAIGCEDGTVQLRDPTGAKITAFPGHHAGPVESVAFSPQGTILASGGADHTIRLWDAATGSAITVLSGHTDAVWSVAFSPDGKTLASASSDNTIRLWDLANYKATAILRGHTGEVASVAFSPDGTILASGSEDHTIRLWKVP